jgi:anti-sigma-K factor RskA
MLLMDNPNNQVGEQTDPTFDRRRRRLTPQAGLWASAFVLAAIIVVQAGRLGPSEARADLVSAAGGVTALTVEASNEDVLLVVDTRSDALMAYKVVNQKDLDLYKTYNLPRIFGDARNRAGRK